MSAKNPTVKELLLAQASRDALIQQTLSELVKHVVPRPTKVTPPKPARGAAPVIKP